MFEMCYLKANARSSYKQQAIDLLAKTSLSIEKRMKKISKQIAFFYTHHINKT